MNVPDEARVPGSGRRLRRAGGPRAGRAVGRAREGLGPRSPRSPRRITISRTPTTSSAGSSTASTSTTARGLHRPDFEVASLFIEQTPANDLGRDKARRHDVRLSPNVADALMLGTGKVAVDAVLLIAEHGDYPFNAKLQKLYPRGKLFREILEVLKTFDAWVPIFVDKHLSYDATEARRMYDAAKAAKIPLMAGSSLPVTWRLPELEVPLGLPVERGRGRLSGRDRDLRLPRPGVAPVHGRAARPEGQAARGRGRDLPRGGGGLGGPGSRGLVGGPARRRPCRGATPSTPATSARTPATSSRRRPPLVPGRADRLRRRVRRRIPGDGPDPQRARRRHHHRPPARPPRTVLNRSSRPSSTSPRRRERGSSTRWSSGSRSSSGRADRRTRSSGPC